MLHEQLVDPVGTLHPEQMGRTVHHLETSVQDPIGEPATVPRRQQRIMGCRHHQGGQTQPRHEVRQALADLTEEFRLPVYFADVEGFAYKEIAEILDVPMGTVMSRLHRGRRRLRAQLEDYARERGFVPSPA